MDWNGYNKHKTLSTIMTLIRQEYGKKEIGMNLFLSLLKKLIACSLAQGCDQKARARTPAMVAAAAVM